MNRFSPAPSRRSRWHRAAARRRNHRPAPPCWPDRVAVVAHRLGLRHRDVDVVARVAAGLDADAALQALFAQVGAPGPGRDHQVDGVALGADAQLLGADPGQRPDVAAFQLVGAHHLLLRLDHLLEAVRDLHAQDLRAVEQPLGVLAQAEDRRAAHGVVGAHAFEGAAAIVQRVGQHVDLGSRQSTSWPSIQILPSRSDIDMFGPRVSGGGRRF